VTSRLAARWAAAAAAAAVAAAAAAARHFFNISLVAPPQGILTNVCPHPSHCPAILYTVPDPE